MCICIYTYIYQAWQDGAHRWPWEEINEELGQKVLKLVEERLVYVNDKYEKKALDDPEGRIQITDGGLGIWNKESYITVG